MILKRKPNKNCGDIIQVNFRQLYTYWRTMKSPLIIVMVMIFGAALGAPQNRNQPAYITKYYNDQTHLDGYNFDVETSDGFKHKQTGVLRNNGKDDQFLVVTGSYSYINPDGNIYTFHYVADENGFRRQSEPSNGVQPRPVPSRLPSRIGPPISVPTVPPPVRPTSPQRIYYPTAPAPGAPKPGTKTGISCAAIASLCGGGIG